MLRIAKMSTGFPTLDGYTSDAEPELPDAKGTNAKKKKSGGFQSMGLSFDVLGGILKKGYKVPTPIQRKSIPVILEGKDVVGMARTGSGKTAAFLIPMLERLMKNPRQPGARALILSPTRELAVQTFKFTKELGKCCSLKAELILGGDNMSEQFAAVHARPDILIATPGRLLHVLMEMDLKLKFVEYLVFDEADRLFEMGFAEQLKEILHRVPDARQTLLFSATLPKSLVEFTKAGLNDPTLIRLDVENKISQDLQMSFFYTRTSEKLAVLLHLLKEVVRPEELTVVFLATKHHVEYVQEILAAANISCTSIFSALDPAARKINIAKFAAKKTNVLLVTDIAARGIDIPMLDNVINFHFPGKPKLFVHRVGRVARAGRTGRAFSIICPDEVAYLLDLHLFLGQKLKLANTDYPKDEDNVLGKVPQVLLDEQEELLRHYHEHSVDLVNIRRVSSNAMKQFIKSRPLPSPASIKRVKSIDLDGLLFHPLFDFVNTASESKRSELVDDIKRYKPNSTIFEINSTAKKVSSVVMRSKRKKHGELIKKLRSRADEGKNVADDGEERDADGNSDIIQGSVSIVDRTKHQSSDKSGEGVGKTTSFKSCRDDEYYIPHSSADLQTEIGLGIKSSFEQQAASEMLDLTVDESSAMRDQTKRVKWDRKRKRFIDEGGKERPKKIKTESGAVISATYKKNIYQDWLKKTKNEGLFDRITSPDDVEGEDGSSHRKGVHTTGFRSRYRHKKGAKSGEDAVDEIKSKEAILKMRKRKQRDKAKNAPRKIKQANRAEKMARGAMKRGKGGSFDVGFGRVVQPKWKGKRR